MCPVQTFLPNNCRRASNNDRTGWAVIENHIRKIGV